MNLENGAEQFLKANKEIWQKYVDRFDSVRVDLIPCNEESSKLKYEVIVFANSFRDRDEAKAKGFDKKKFLGVADGESFYILGYIEYQADEKSYTFVEDFK